jgi:fatty acid desaturase
MKRWPLGISITWAILITVVTLIAGVDALGAILAGAFVGFVVYVPLAVIAWLFGRCGPTKES